MNYELKHVLPSTYEVGIYLQCPVRHQNRSSLTNGKMDTRTELELKKIYRPWCTRVVREMLPLSPEGTRKITEDQEALVKKLKSKSFITETNMELTQKEINRHVKALPACTVNVRKLVTDKQWVQTIALGFPLSQAGLNGLADVVVASKYGLYLVKFVIDKPESYPYYLGELEVITWAFEKIVNKYSAKEWWVNFPMLYFPLSGIEVVLPRTREHNIEPLIDAMREKYVWHNRGFCSQCEITTCNIQTNFERNTK